MLKLYSHYNIITFLVNIITFLVNIITFIVNINTFQGNVITLFAQPNTTHVRYYYYFYPCQSPLLLSFLEIMCSPIATTKISST